MEGYRTPTKGGSMASRFRTFAHLPLCPDEEAPIAVYYTAHLAIKGKRNKYGVQMEPDEPGAIEIESVVGPDGSKVTLSGDVIERIREEISEYEIEKLV